METFLASLFLCVIVRDLEWNGFTKRIYVNMLKKNKDQKVVEVFMYYLIQDFNGN